MPPHKLAFRVTHRFTRPLGRGDFGDLLSDFFGFDSGAQIGLELRYGLARGTQVGIYRTSDRTIEIFGQHSLLQEHDAMPVGIDIMGTFEGREQPPGRLVAGRRRDCVAEGSRDTPRCTPSRSSSSTRTRWTRAWSSSNDTFMLGLGGRLRIRPSTYIVGEYTPRLAGYTPGVGLITFGLEGRAGGHLFQVNFSNGIGTTLGQIARGSVDNNSWFIGFNISRKFF